MRIKESHRRKPTKSSLPLITILILAAVGANYYTPAPGPPKDTRSRFEKNVDLTIKWGGKAAKIAAIAATL